MRELYVNGVCVRYKTNEELQRLLAIEIRRAQWHRQPNRLDELDKTRRKVRQLHEPPTESSFAL